MWLIEDQLKEYDDHEKLSELIYIIYEGANVGIKNYRDTWPIDRAIEATRIVLEGSGK